MRKIKSHVKHRGYKIWEEDFRTAPQTTIATWNLASCRNFVLESGRNCLAVEIKSTTRWEDRDLHGLKAFLSTTPHCKETILGYHGTEAVKPGEKLWALPINLTLSWFRDWVEQKDTGWPGNQVRGYQSSRVQADAALIAVDLFNDEVLPSAEGICISQLEKDARAAFSGSNVSEKLSSSQLLQLHKCKWKPYSAIDISSRF